MGDEAAAAGEECWHRPSARLSASTCPSCSGDGERCRTGPRIIISRAATTACTS
eukprot:CAMPEP_0195132332 /NCGR_PEP_ID=MMETSP0448-20130528/146732_1 /TAXON_ID=66468 /ORGANISM="Heterocapsa triquestra, Strain CCMP 448" /LENGTH=53 /DNA_ID=CAMNT_0040170337 /DNA_START=37 /DNA_END=194 /DNA_ORIENTATION=+